MIRATFLALLAVVLISMGPASGSPVSGQRRVRDITPEGKRIVPVLQPGATWKLGEIYRGNERACVIASGDHESPIKLTIQVRDAAGKVVAEETGDEYVAAIWYPPQTQRYEILISIDGEKASSLEIVLK